MRGRAPWLEASPKRSSAVNSVAVRQRRRAPHSRRHPRPQRAERDDEELRKSAQGAGRPALFEIFPSRNPSRRDLKHEARKHARNTDDMNPTRSTAQQLRSAPTEMSTIVSKAPRRGMVTVTSRTQARAEDHDRSRVVSKEMSQCSGSRGGRGQHAIRKVDDELKPSRRLMAGRLPG